MNAQYEVFTSRRTPKSFVLDVQLVGHLAGPAAGLDHVTDCALTRLGRVLPARCHWFDFLLPQDRGSYVRRGDIKPGAIQKGIYVEYGPSFLTPSGFDTTSELEGRE